MFRQFTVVALIVALLAASAHAQRRGRQGQGQQGRGRMQQHPPIAQVIESFPKADLNEQEQADLLFMLEEEKLAHDVYVALEKQWQLRPLENIPRAETMHMQAVRALLTRYDVADPVAKHKAGKFASAEMQKLYDALIEKGGRSVEDAVRVGLEIEELDIADLAKRIERTDNDDVKVIYQNLMKGSRNHLRAFDRQATGAVGADYAAQHLCQETYDAILLGAMERGQLIRDPDFAYLKAKKGQTARQAPSAEATPDDQAADAPTEDPSDDG